MKEIKLKSGGSVLVDDLDFEYLNQWKWYLSSQGYPHRQISRGKFITMHKVINNTPSGFDTDHINRNKLDNRRKNLRTASRSLNTRNSPVRIDNKSGYKGVDFYKRIQKWRVRLTINNKDVSLGYYADIKKAVIARKNAEILYGYSK